MKIIKCAFRTQDLNDYSLMYDILKAGRHCVKLWALYGCRHITDQYFKPRCLELKSEPIENLDSLVRHLMYVQNPTFYNNDVCRRLAMRYWDYFNPNIRKKIKLEFAAGSAIKSIIFK